MKIPEFIEKAIEGGWIGFDQTETEWLFDMRHRYGRQWINDFVNANILLDPEAWKAVGKACMWSSLEDKYYDGMAWLEQWHRMIDALAEGKTIEAYLETL